MTLFTSEKNVYYVPLKLMKKMSKNETRQAMILQQ